VGSWCPWVFPRLFLCSLPSACVLLLLELFLTSHPEVGGGRSGTTEAALVAAFMQAAGKRSRNSPSLARHGR
jgi:hypothetical protein